MEKEYEILKLSNQICFPLYACGKEITRKYKPVLDKFGITYTQYIVLLVLWENDHLSVKEIGKRLFLDSGTLTPLLEKLEQKGLIERIRKQEDARELEICLTQKGNDIKKDVINVPIEISKKVNLTGEEAKTLYYLLYKVLGGLTENE